MRDLLVSVAMTALYEGAVQRGCDYLVSCDFLFEVSRSVEAENRGQRQYLSSLELVSPRVRSLCTHLVKRPGIAETALKHLVDRPFGLFPVAATRWIHQDA